MKIIRPEENRFIEKTPFECIVVRATDWSETWNPRRTISLNRRVGFDDANHDSFRKNQVVNVILVIDVRQSDWWQLHNGSQANMCHSSWLKTAVRRTIVADTALGLSRTCEVWTKRETCLPTSQSFIRIFMIVFGLFSAMASLEACSNRFAVTRPFSNIDFGSRHFSSLSVSGVFLSWHLTNVFPYRLYWFEMSGNASIWCSKSFHAIARLLRAWLSAINQNFNDILSNNPFLFVRRHLVSIWRVSLYLRLRRFHWIEKC
jgi:hypothetical protein